MRANRRFAVLAIMAACMPAAALAAALPPPPYANDQNEPDRYGAVSARPQDLDRYGGGYHRPSASYGAPISQDGPLVAPLAGPTLNWNGKVEAQAQPAPSSQQGGWTSMSARWNAAPQTQAQAQTSPEQRAADMAPPSNPWRPYQPFAAARAAAPAAPAPTSIYDAPMQQAPAPQPYRQAQATTSPNPGGGPHFYSLHREYGIAADPIPLPPQFFGPTADLSASVADPLAKRTITVNGQTKTVNAPDDQGPQ